MAAAAGQVFETHDQAYTHIKNAVLEGAVPRGLPLLLVDYHSDDVSAGSEDAGAANWVSKLKEEGWIGRVFWLYPERGRFLLGAGRYLHRQSGDIALLLAQEVFPQGLILSVDLDYFTTSPCAGQAAYAVKPGEIADAGGRIVAYLREHQISVRLMNGALSRLYAQWDRKNAEAFEEFRAWIEACGDAAGRALSSPAIGGPRRSWQPEPPAGGTRDFTPEGLELLEELLRELKNPRLVMRMLKNFQSCYCSYAPERIDETERGIFLIKKYFVLKRILNKENMYWVVQTAVYEMLRRYGPEDRMPSSPALSRGVLSPADILKIVPPSIGKAGCFIVDNFHAYHGDMVRSIIETQPGTLCETWAVNAGNWDGMAIEKTLLKEALRNILDFTRRYADVRLAVHMSFGGKFYLETDIEHYRLLERIREQGIPVIVSAGHRRSEELVYRAPFPACVPGVVTVASLSPLADELHEHSLPGDFAMPTIDRNGSTSYTAAAFSSLLLFIMATKNMKGMDAVRLMREAAVPLSIGGWNREIVAGFMEPVTTTQAVLHANVWKRLEALSSPAQKKAPGREGAPAKTKNHWEELYGNRNYSDSGGKWGMRALLEHLLEFRLPQRGRPLSILDIGGHRGEVFSGSRLRGMAMNVLVVDTGFPAELGREGNIVFLKGDAEQLDRLALPGYSHLFGGKAAALPLADLKSSFDIVLLSDILNYVDFRKVVSLSIPFVSPEGYLVLLNTPDQDDGQGTFLSLFSPQGVKKSGQLEDYVERQHGAALEQVDVNREFDAGGGTGGLMYALSMLGSPRSELLLFRPRPAASSRNMPGDFSSPAAPQPYSEDDVFRFLWERRHHKVLIVVDGPSGSGKTTSVRRIAARVRRQKEMKKKFIVLEGDKIDPYRHHFFRHGHYARELKGVLHRILDRGKTLILLEGCHSKREFLLVRHDFDDLEVLFLDMITAPYEVDPDISSPSRKHIFEVAGERFKMRVAGDAYSPMMRFSSQAGEDAGFIYGLTQPSLADGQERFGIRGMRLEAGFRGRGLAVPFIREFMVFFPTFWLHENIIPTLGFIMQRSFGFEPAAPRLENLVHIGRPGTDGIIPLFFPLIRNADGALPANGVDLEFRLVDFVLTDYVKAYVHTDYRGPAVSSPARTRDLVDFSQFNKMDYFDFPVLVGDGPWAERITLCTSLIVAHPSAMFLRRYAGDRPIQHSFDRDLLIGDFAKTVTLPDTRFLFVHTKISDEREFIYEVVYRLVDLGIGEDRIATEPLRQSVPMISIFVYPDGRVVLHKKEGERLLDPLTLAEVVTYSDYLRDLSKPQITAYKDGEPSSFSSPAAVETSTQSREHFLAGSLAMIDRMPSEQKQIEEWLATVRISPIHLERVLAAGRRFGDEDQAELCGYAAGLTDHGRLLGLLKKYAFPLGAKHLLEIGPGSASFLLALREGGVCAQGLESNPELAGLARQEGLVVAAGNLLEPPAQMLERPYDVTFSHYVLDVPSLMQSRMYFQGRVFMTPELQSEGIKMLAQMARLTRPAGVSIHEIGLAPYWPFIAEDIRRAGFSIREGGLRENFLVLQRSLQVSSPAVLKEGLGTVGLVGLGRHGRRHLKTLVDLSAGVRAVDRTIDATIYEKFGHNDLVQLSQIEAAELFDDPAVKAVIIVTPGNTHYELVKQALAAGKHVLVEKPFTETTDEARKLVALAADRRLVLMVGHNRFYLPHFQRLMIMVKSGQLGDILAVEGKYMHPYQNDDRTHTALEGMGYHLFYMIHGLLDQDRPTRLTKGACSEDWEKVALELLYRNVPVTLTMDRDFTRKVVYVTVYGSKFSATFDWSHEPAFTQLLVASAQPDAIFDPNSPDATLLRQLQGQNVLEGEDAEPSLYHELKVFLEAIRTQIHPPSDGVAAIHIVETIEEIRLALKHSNNSFSSPSLGPGFGSRRRPRPGSGRSPQRETNLDALASSSSPSASLRTSPAGETAHSSSEGIKPYILANSFFGPIVVKGNESCIQLAKEIARDHFGIRNIVDARQMHNGTGSKHKPVLIETSSRKVILRRGGAAQEELRYIVSVTNRLHEYGLPVARLYPRIDSDDQGADRYFVERDSSFYRAEEFVERGKNISVQDATLIHFEAMGRLAARINNSMEGFVPEGSRLWKKRLEILDDLEGALRGYMDEVLMVPQAQRHPEQQAFVDHFMFFMGQAEIARRRYQGNGSAIVPIHNDLHPENVKFDDMGEVVGLFDFCISQSDERIVEINNLVLGHNAAATPVFYDGEKLFRVVAAYDGAAHRKFSVDEIRNIVEVIRIRFLEIIYTRFVRHHPFRLTNIFDYPELAPFAVTEIGMFRQFAREFAYESQTEAFVNRVTEQRLFSACETDSLSSPAEKRIEGALGDRRISFGNIIDSGMDVALVPEEKISQEKGKSSFVYDIVCNGQAVRGNRVHVEIDSQNREINVPVIWTANHPAAARFRGVGLSVLEFLRYEALRLGYSIRFTDVQSPRLAGMIGIFFEDLRQAQEHSRGYDPEAIPWRGWLNCDIIGKPRVRAVLDGISSPGLIKTGARLSAKPREVSPAVADSPADAQRSPAVFDVTRLAEEGFEKIALGGRDYGFLFSEMLCVGADARYVTGLTVEAFDVSPRRQVMDLVGYVDVGFTPSDGFMHMAYHQEDMDEGLFEARRGALKIWGGDSGSVSKMLHAARTSAFAKQGAEFQDCYALGVKEGYRRQALGSILYASALRLTMNHGKTMFSVVNGRTGDCSLYMRFIKPERRPAVLRGGYGDIINFSLLDDVSWTSSGGLSLAAQPDGRLVFLVAPPRGAGRIDSGNSLSSPAVPVERRTLRFRSERIGRTMEAFRQERIPLLFFKNFTEWLDLQKDYAALTDQVMALRLLLTLPETPDFMMWAKYYLKMEEARRALEIFCAYKLLHFSEGDYVRSRRILQRLMKKSRIAGRQPLLVSKGEQWIDEYNASVTGSFIFLGQPTVRALDDHELAAVLAHELGHKRKKHALEYLRFVSRHGWPVGENKGPWEVLCHRQEFEADAFAVHCLSKARYRPEALVSSLAKLESHFLDQPSIQLFLRLASQDRFQRDKEAVQEDGEEDRRKILKTHPPFAERVAAIQKEIKSLSSPAGAVVGPVAGKPHVQVMPDHGLAFNTWALAGVKGAVLIHADAHADTAVPAAAGWEECADADLWGLRFKEGSFIHPAVYYGMIDEIYYVVPSHSEDKPSEREMVVNSRRISVHVLRLSDLPDFRREQRPVLVDIDEDYFVEQGNMKSEVYRKIAFGSPRQEIESELGQVITWFLKRLFTASGVTTPLVTIAESPDWVPQNFVPFITQTLKTEINRMVSVSGGQVGDDSDSSISSPSLRSGRRQQDVMNLNFSAVSSGPAAGAVSRLSSVSVPLFGFDDELSGGNRVFVSDLSALRGGLYTIEDFDGRGSLSAQAGDREEVGTGAIIRIP